jgi:hypothetical protein
MRHPDFVIGVLGVRDVKLIERSTELRMGIAAGRRALVDSKDAGPLMCHSLGSLCVFESSLRGRLHTFTLSAFFETLCVGLWTSRGKRRTSQ